MSKTLLPILLCIFFLSGCVETVEQKADRIHEEESTYQSAYDDGYAAGYNENKSEDARKLEDEISNLKQQIEDLEWELGFYEERIALVTTNDRLIHSYSCKSSSASYYEIIFLDDPVLNRYELCPDCHLPTYEEIQQVLPAEKVIGPTQ